MPRLSKLLRHLLRLVVEHGVIWPVVSLVITSVFGISADIVSDTLRELWRAPPEGLSNPWLRTGLPVASAVWLAYRLWEGPPAALKPEPVPATAATQPGNVGSSPPPTLDAPELSSGQRFQSYIVKLAQEGSDLVGRYAFIPNHADLRWLSSAGEVRDQLEARYGSNQFCKEIDGVNKNRNYREQVEQVAAILKQVEPAIESGVLRERNS